MMKINIVMLSVKETVNQTASIEKEFCLLHVMLCNMDMKCFFKSAVYDLPA